MPTRTKSAWYAHCWIFCLSQLECPLTGLGVELECPLAQLIHPGKDTGIYKFSRAFSLVSLSHAKASHRPSHFSLATRMTSWNVITSSSDFSELPVISRYVFHHNLDCVLLLFVFIRLDRNYDLYFYLNCWQNCFCKVLICSLPSGDLLLQTECKYTIVKINTHYNVLVNQVFANPVSVFILLEFSSWL